MKYPEILFYAPFLDTLRLDGAGTRASFVLKSLSTYFSSFASLEKGRFKLFPYQLFSGFIVWPTFNLKIFSAISALFLGQHYIRAKHVNVITSAVLCLFFYFF